jgi:hypothetical protein
MTQVTLTISLRFREEIYDKLMTLSEDTTASMLTEYLSKYAYGGLPVYLTDGNRRLKGKEVLGPLRGEKLQCLPSK